MGALTSIPRSEPILDDLLEVAAHNDRVDRIRDVIEANFDRVAALIDPLVPDDLLASAPADSWPWAEWSSGIHTLAISNAGIGYATYLRLKVSSVLDGFAQSICAICGYPDDSNHATLVRNAVHYWGREAGLYVGMQRDPNADPCDDGPAAEAHPAPFEPSEAQVRFLQAFDLGFMRRRLRFVIAALNWWYRCIGTDGFPTREQLDNSKATLYRNVATLDALAQLQTLDSNTETKERAQQLRQLVCDAFPETQLANFIEKHGVDGDAYSKEHAAPLAILFEQAQTFLDDQLHQFAPALLSQLVPLTTDWNARRRRDLVVRYLGFPIWDVLLYPIQALSQIGEGDHIDVVRISPHEATILPTPQGGKVEGTRVHHFYAFFSREARENDYLWGRLDSAEQLVRLLLDSSGSDQSVEHWSKRLFTAILAEEERSLTTIPGKVADLRRQAEATPATSGRGSDPHA